MKKKRPIYKILREGRLSVVRTVPEDSDEVEIINEEFYGTLYFMSISEYSITLLSREGKEKYDEIVRFRDKAPRRDLSAWHVIARCWSDFNKQYLRYRVSYAEAPNIISHMINGKISGRWVWKFSGGVAAVKYLGD